MGPWDLVDNLPDTCFRSLRSLSRRPRCPQGIMASPLELVYLRKSYLRPSTIIYPRRKLIARPIRSTTMWMPRRAPFPMLLLHDRRAPLPLADARAKRGVGNLLEPTMTPDPRINYLPQRSRISSTVSISGGGGDREPVCDGKPNRT